MREEKKRKAGKSGKWEGKDKNNEREERRAEERGEERSGEERRGEERRGEGEVMGKQRIQLHMSEEEMGKYKKGEKRREEGRETLCKMKNCAPLCKLKESLDKVS